MLLPLLFELMEMWNATFLTHYKIYLKVLMTEDYYKFNVKF